jgi:hypothetical protein
MKEILKGRNKQFFLDVKHGDSIIMRDNLIEKCISFKLKYFG